MSHVFVLLPLGSIKRLVGYNSDGQDGLRQVTRSCFEDGREGGGQNGFCVAFLCHGAGPVQCFFRSLSCHA